MNGEPFITAGDSTTITLFAPCQWEDAQFIVQAVNSHKEMLAALNAIMQLLYYDRQAGHWALAHPDNYPTIDEDAVMDARAAVTKAKGELP
jgi:hypothetical protein